MHNMSIILSWASLNSAVNTFEKNTLQNRWSVKRLHCSLLAKWHTAINYDTCRWHYIPPLLDLHINIWYPSRVSELCMRYFFKLHVQLYPLWHIYTDNIFDILDKILTVLLPCAVHQFTYVCQKKQCLFSSLCKFRGWYPIQFLLWWTSQILLIVLCTRIQPIHCLHVTNTWRYPIQCYAFFWYQLTNWLTYHC